ncbi:predicted protein [Naegleria gruberi]|uniref:Predicted protein n=1 Tax=Naegleria gruberi TaxID=5762 RepID=D2UYR0_NAEGR|nr:uncharacterized protein NAEGRDRAFT_45239 [Naegleria gruberi]EFC50523.1 predicted protein [Naegleria gruberi]|eukprot:XP_002683267.1 predicted protein [Naegleria gruberi strain NEG-M]
MSKNFNFRSEKVSSSSTASTSGSSSGNKKDVTKTSSMFKSTKPTENNSTTTTITYKDMPITFKKEDVEVISNSGIVLIKTFRNHPNLQQDLINYCLSALRGNEEGITGTEFPTDETTFQKCFLDIPFEQFNSKFADIICGAAMKVAKEHCKILQDYQDDFRIAQLCYYTNKGKLGWHRDRISGLTPEEQHLIVSPVVSMSLGNDSIFSYKLNTINETTGKLEYGTEAIDLQLKSGDILIFGATQRMFYHCVKRIIPSTNHHKLDMDGLSGRINITLREGTYYPENIGAPTANLF